MHFSASGSFAKSKIKITRNWRTDAALAPQNAFETTLTWKVYERREFRHEIPFPRGYPKKFIAICANFWGALYRLRTQMGGQMTGKHVSGHVCARAFSKCQTKNDSEFSSCLYFTRPPSLRFTSTSHHSACGSTSKFKWDLRLRRLRLIGTGDAKKSEVERFDYFLVNLRRSKKINRWVGSWTVFSFWSTSKWTHHVKKALIPLKSMVLSKLKKTSLFCNKFIWPRLGDGYHHQLPKNHFSDGSGSLQNF